MTCPPPPVSGGLGGGLQPDVTSGIKTGFAREERAGFGVKGTMWPLGVCLKGWLGHAMSDEVFRDAL